MRNGFGGGAAPVINLKNINTFDAADFLSQAASTSVGERAILNVLNNNKSQLRSMLNGR